MTGRTIGLTRRGWTVAGAAGGLLVGGRLLGADELSVLGLAAIAVILGAGLWVAATRPRLSAHRRVEPRRVHVDDPARVDLTVSATRTTPLVDVTEMIDHGRLRARFLLAPLRAGEHATPAYRLPTDRRGPVALGPTAAAHSDPLGLAHRRRPVAPEQTVLVRPRVHVIAPPATGAGRRAAADDAETTRAPAADAGGDFLAVRPYEFGDDPRRIHWRSTARADDLMVRQYAAPRRGHTLVLLDTRAGSAATGTDAAADPDVDAAFEIAVEAVASIVAALARTGRPFECLTTGGTVLAARGADLQRTFDRLATVMADEPDLLDAVARARHPLPPEQVVLVTARADGRIAGARAVLARRAPAVLVATGGDPAAVSGRTRAGGPVVDARHVAFPEAWRAAHPAQRRAPVARPAAPLSVVR